MSIRLRATITFEYDANPRWYDSIDPKYMSEIDESNFSCGTGDGRLFEVLAEHYYTVKVESIE